MQKAGLGRKAGNELPHGLLSESHRHWPHLASCFYPLGRFRRGDTGKLQAGAQSRGLAGHGGPKWNGDAGEVTSACMADIPWRGRVELAVAGGETTTFSASR